MDWIRIRGARTHNLRQLDLDLPRHRLIVISGVSGSGKSSLAFDTLYAEGQRRYLESLSSHARHILTPLPPAEVDTIEGLPPAIAITAATAGHHPRSTVGTLTEILDYARVLFARLGTPHCPEHGTALAAQTVAQMVDAVLALPAATRWMLLAPVPAARGHMQRMVFDELQAQGFARVRIDGVVYDLDPLPQVHGTLIEVVVDRFRVRPDLRPRLAESLETALRLGGGVVRVAPLEDDHPPVTFSSVFACPECGFSLPALQPQHLSFNHPAGACPRCAGLGTSAAGALCSECGGARLNRAARHILLASCSLPALSAWPLPQVLDWCTQLPLTGQQAVIAAPLQAALERRLRTLLALGLEDLSLARGADTLSGGEMQRLRLARQLGAGLSGVLYLLDEPGRSLHRRDRARLLSALLQLRDLGNTVVAVEHDDEMIRAADWVVELGPGAGTAGGALIAAGPPAALVANPASLTGQYLAGTRRIPVPSVRRSSSRWLHLRGACGHNLKDIDVALPVGVLCCITGVSGSGKSTLIDATLSPLAVNKLHGGRRRVAPYRSIAGLEHFDRVIAVDQQPLGRTPRATPVTYLGAFAPIRALFAAVPEARARGFGPERFSFNVKGGRCEACKGEGWLRVELHYLPAVYVRCDQCGGRRYDRETLTVRYKGHTIAEVLELSAAEALRLFAPVPAVARLLGTLVEVGLPYLPLGQSATTLSGGEAQRIKLARELARRDTGRTLYLLDEPTAGLHLHDIADLLALLQRLCDQGNTVIVIEHQLDVIKSADWVIDLGPEGGARGGEIVAAGPPEEIAACPRSHTGRYLKPLLEQADLPHRG